MPLFKKASSETVKQELHNVKNEDAKDGAIRNEIYLGTCPVTLPNYAALHKGFADFVFLLEDLPFPVNCNRGAVDNAFNAGTPTPCKPPGTLRAFIEFFPLHAVPSMTTSSARFMFFLHVGPWDATTISTTVIEYQREL